MARVKWKGEDLGEWAGKPTLQECRRIKSELGLLPVEWQEQFEQMDPDAWCIFVAFMLSRKGERVNFEDVDGSYDDLEVIHDAEESAAVKEAEKAEAGKASPNGSKPAASRKSKPSATTPASPTST